MCWAAGLTAAIAVIPPWQNPDEPQHLITVRLIETRGASFGVDSATGSGHERTIIASMAQYDWWRHYGQPTPDPLPATFAEGPSKVIGGYFGTPGGGSRLYYRALAGLFAATSVDGVLPQLYTMRALSAIAALLTLWGIWSGARALLDERAALVIAVLAALHPQFAIVSTTASPDALVNLAGALVWRQSAVLIASGVTVAGLAGLWAAAIAAFVLRRMGAPLLAIAAVVTLGVALRDMRRQNAWRPLVAGAVTMIALLAVTAGVLARDLGRALDWVSGYGAPSASMVAANAGDLLRFLAALFRSFWLTAGWLQYSAPAWWNAITILVAVVAAVGLLRVAKATPRSGAIWLNVAAVAIQVGAVVVFYLGFDQGGAQGRYVIPVLPAFLCLLWLGWQQVVGAPRPGSGQGGRPRLAAASIVLVMAFLNASAWLWVVFPAYI